MRILSIVWFNVLPAKYGGQKGTANFNKYLANYSELTVLAAKSNKTDEKLNYRLIPELPNGKLQFINPFTWYKIYKTAKTYKAQVIILEYPYHTIAGIIAKKLLNLKLVLHEHNIEFDRFRKQGKWWWRLLKWYEGWAVKNAKMVIFKTEFDLQNGIKYFKIINKYTIVSYPIEKTIIYENAATEIRKKHNIRKEEKILLFAGTLDYLPNAIAVKNIFTRIIPKLDKQSIDYRIIICGRNDLQQFQYLKEFHHNKVITPGEVMDIEKYFVAADLFVNPVNQGGGIQTKTLESISLGTPVITFEKMAKPIESKNFLIIVKDDDWGDYCNKIIHTLKTEKPKFITKPFLEVTEPEIVNLVKELEGL